MPKEIILKVGDAIEYFSGRSAVIEKIRIISTGELVEQYKYDGQGYDIVLTLKDKLGMIDLWLKDTPIRILETKKSAKQE